MTTTTTPPPNNRDPRPKFRRTSLVHLRISTAAAIIMRDRRIEREAAAVLEAWLMARAEPKPPRV